MKNVAILLPFLLMAAPAQAQEVTDETAALVEGLYDKVDQLTAAVNELQAAVTASTRKKEVKESWTERVSFSGKSYLNYGVLLAGQAAGQPLTLHKNGFDVTRAYLTVQARPTVWSTFKLTTDLGRVNDPKGEDSLGGPLKMSFDNRYFVYIKYAYLDMEEPLLHGKIVLGQQGLPGTELVEHLWNYRWVSKVLTDLQLLQTTTDLGVAYKGKAGKYLEYHLAVVNGSGYKEPEADTFKNPMARLTGYPVKGLTVSLFGSYDVRSLEERSGNPWTVEALADYKLDRWGNVGVEYARGRNRKNAALGWGMSSFAIAKPWQESRVVLRYDMYDGDSDSNTDNSHLLIAGLGWDFNKYLQTLVDVEIDTQDRDNQATTGYWNWQAAF